MPNRPSPKQQIAAIQRLLQFHAPTNHTWRCVVPKILPVSELLPLIEPVDPDNLYHTGQGIYRAIWLTKNINNWELYVLQHTDRITITRGPFTPPAMPAFTAVEFTVD